MIRQVLIPALSHLQVEACPQEVMHIIRLVCKDHSDHDCWIFRLNASFCSYFLKNDGTLIVLGIVLGEFFNLVLEERDEL